MRCDGWYLAIGSGLLRFNAPDLQNPFPCPQPPVPDGGVELDGGLGSDANVEDPDAGTTDEPGDDEPDENDEPDEDDEPGEDEPGDGDEPESIDAGMLNDDAAEQDAARTRRPAPDHESCAMHPVRRGSGWYFGLLVWLFALRKRRRA